MSIRDKQKQSTFNLLPREAGIANPVGATDGGRLIRNFIPRKGGYLERKTAAQLFCSSNTTDNPQFTASRVTRLIDFKYQTPTGGDISELIIVKDNGRIYRKHRGSEEEIYPTFYVRPTLHTQLVSTTTTPFSAIDDKLDTRARLSGNGTNDPRSRWNGFATPSGRAIASLSLVIRNQFENNAPNNSTGTLRYSLDAGSSFTVIYSQSPDRALQNDTVSLAAAQAIPNIWVEAECATSGGLSSADLDVYDIRLEANWSGARVLANPRDVQYVVANNKLFISDGDQSLVYLGMREGGGWYIWGMPAPTQAPAVVRRTPGITNTTGRKHAVTWVHIVDGVTIHESSRSPIADCLPVTNQFYEVHRPSSPPERATHWRIYSSSVDGATALFRTATVAIGTLIYEDRSVDYGTAGSTMISIRAPVRNDPPPKSKMLELHKQRIFARNEEQKNELWFSALGEVGGLKHLAPEESFPGFATESNSDIENFDDVPDQTSELVGSKSWADVLWFFTKKEGFYYAGEGGLLDSIALRDFRPFKAFRVGVAGPRCITSCPFGLVWMTPDRTMQLYSGGGVTGDFTSALLDIGQEKQTLFNQIADQDLERAELLYYLPYNSLVFRFTTTEGTNRLYLYSFDLRQPDRGLYGGWYHFNDVDPTAIGTFFDKNKEFLLVGEADGEVRAIQQITGNSVIGKAEGLIGSLVLGASSNITNYPAATYRTPNTNVGYDGAKILDYTVVHSHRQSNFDDAVSTQVAPTTAFYADVADPETPGSSTSVTMSAVTKGRNFRGRIGASGGTYADRIMLEYAFATGVPEGTADGNDFLECHTSRLNGLGLIWHPKEEQILNP